MTNSGSRLRWSARRGVAGLLILTLGAGCTTTLRELRLKEPRITREAAGTPAAIVQCVQDHIEEHYGGLWGRLGGVGYETRAEAATTHLVGRILMNPADVLFDLAVTPRSADRAALRLHVDAPWHPWLETPVIEAVDVCAPPAP